MKMLGNILIAIGLVAFLMAAALFTAGGKLPVFIERLGEYCFYWWWAPLIAGWILRKIAERRSGETRMT